MSIKVIMNINEWINKLNSIKINDILRDNIIIFFTKFRSPESLSFIKVEDIDMIAAFNNVNNYKPLSICLDIEFQSTLLKKKNKYISTINNAGHQTAKFIRELGMLFFIKDISNWYYIGSIFLNFNSLEHYGFNINKLRLIGSKYATVTKETYNEIVKSETAFNLDQLITPLQDKQLFNNHQQYIKNIYDTIKELKSNYLFNKILKKQIREKILDILKKIMEYDDFNDVDRELKYIKKQLYNIQYDIYGEYLDDVILNKFITTHRLYWTDKLVKKRVALTNNKEKLFFAVFSDLLKDCILIVKGGMDIIAIKNMSNLISHNVIDIENYYDIETFNGFSRALYGSSQLEETYNRLIKTNIFSSTAKEFFDQISSNIGNKAHNPLVDSLFTIIVAITINLGLNKYFGKLDQRGGNFHYEQYIKLKNKYTMLKQ